MTKDNRYKVKQFILYIAKKMNSAERFGEAKLNKVLYRADHEALRQLGRKITTYNYQKNNYGPTLSAYKPLLQEMATAGLIAWETRPAGQQVENRPCAVGEPDMDVFLPEEVSIIDQEIERAWSSSGRGVSDEEHETAAWYATRRGSPINSSLTLVEDPRVIIPLSDDERQMADAALSRFFARTGSS